MERIGTTDLLRQLNEDPEARCATIDHGKPMTARRLAKYPAAFGIKPDVRRIDGPPVRGYARSFTWT